MTKSVCDLVKPDEVEFGCLGKVRDRIHKEIHYKVFTQVYDGVWATSGCVLDARDMAFNQMYNGLWSVRGWVI